MGLPRLNNEERMQLLAALTEAKRRGIEIPDHLLGKQEKIRWPLGANGYFVHREGKAYIPTEPQGGFVNSLARFGLFYGSRGSGKSAAGAQKALMKIKQGFSGAVLNPDFENFKSSTWPEFKQWIPWDLVQHKQRYRMEEGWEPHKPFTINFLNGAYARCKGLKDPDSARGPNINWLWYDEGGRDHTGLSWRLAIASVRVGHQPQAWVTATPAGLYHWMHDFFVTGDIPDEVKKLLAEVDDDRDLLDYYHGTIDQNKANLDAGFHAAMLLAYPSGFLREQEIYGEFVEEGGTLGDRRWFNDQIVDAPFAGVDGRLRFWDLAASEKKISKSGKGTDPDETVGSLVSMVGDEFRIENQTSGFWVWRDIKENIKRIALQDGPYVRIRLEEEPGSGGKNQVAAIQEFFQEDPDLKNTPFDVDGYRPEGDRVVLANMWFAEAADKRWTMVKGDWNEGFFRQLDSFPLPGVHDDKVTSVSGARATLKPFSGTKDIDFLHL